MIWVDYKYFNKLTNLQYISPDNWTDYKWEPSMTWKRHLIPPSHYFLFLFLKAFIAFPLPTQ